MHKIFLIILSLGSFQQILADEDVKTLPENFYCEKNITIGRITKSVKKVFHLKQLHLNADGEQVYEILFDKMISHATLSTITSTDSLIELRFQTEHQTEFSVFGSKGTNQFDTWYHTNHPDFPSNNHYNNAYCSHSLNNL